MKLGLGTVQFGMNYGVSNTHGQTDQQSVADILSLAASHQISILDTAPAYGSSEESLGQAWRDEMNFKFVTKVAKIQKEKITQEDVDYSLNIFYQSLKKLKQTAVYGLLVHDAADLLTSGGESLYAGMQGLREKKLVKKIGVSIYTEAELDRLLEKYDFDLIQLPLNVFDQRFIHSGHLRELKKRKVEIHVRSVFLQGLLMMKPKELPVYFSKISSHVEAYQTFLNDQQMTLQEAALGFVMGIDEVDAAVCGVNTLAQLQELLAAKKTVDAADFEKFQLKDECYLNPSQWKL